MPILVDELSVWDISFRWAGYDPRKFYFRIPLEVENNFRNLMNAILSAEIECSSILLEKREYDDYEKKFSIYYWIDDIYACMWGTHINKKLIHWARIERFSFELWCKRMNIPLPEFWFPQGWNQQYNLPENEIHPGYWHIRKDWSKEQLDEYLQVVESNSSIGNNSEDQASIKMRPNQETRITCQRIAQNIWKSEKNVSIADMVKRSEIQELGGAEYFANLVVRRWLSKVAPPEVKARVGRHSNKNTTKDI
jgi:hypothetical protein